MNSPGGLSSSDERYLRGLAELIRRGNCILLLGPGVAVHPTDLQPLPLTVLLARQLAKEVADQSDLVNQDNLAHVAQIFQRKKDRMELELEVGDFYRPFAEQTTDFHRDMAALPFTLCINTTPDDFMCNAFVAAQKKPVCDYYHFRRGHGSRLVARSAQAPLVYSLYGSLSEAESLVLTENDLLEFLVNVVKGSPELPPLIRDRCGDKNTSFLFVGFGFHNWYVRILLHVLNAQSHKNRSLALEDEVFFGHPEQPQTVVFYNREHLIEFKRFSWPQFAQQLRELYEASAVKRTQAASVLPADAPKVFLSYASEDAEAVEQLGEKLQAAGIDTWRDKQNLRAGDNWNRQLVHVIENLVDYVVVVESPAMIDRVEGVFHEEISVALKRQSRFDEGINFVVPVTLSPGKGLARLNHLHRITVDSQAGVDDLVNAIKSDWQKRGGRRREAA